MTALCQKRLKTQRTWRSRAATKTWEEKPRKTQNTRKRETTKPCVAQPAMPTSTHFVFSFRVFRYFVVSLYGPFPCIPCVPWTSTEHTEYDGTEILLRTTRF